MTLTLAYNSPLFFMGMLPAVMFFYQLAGRKLRPYVLLAADYAFLYYWSGKLLLWQVLMVIITYFFGRKLESMQKAPAGMDRKVFKKKKKRILVLSVLLNLGILIGLKYTNFICGTAASIFSFSFTAWNIGVPIGISYYSLQAVSYLSDVSSKKIHATSSVVQLALYMSFFPIVIEGPISRFGEIGESLYAGEGITFENLKTGFIRIVWGLYCKVIIADALSPVVDTIFASYRENGFLCLIGAVLCTLQLYMDFAGTIDIAIGSARIFGVVVPENFRQPFFAANASEFWRRWHITLGAFLRDYVFYPVSLSKPVQKLTKWTRNHLGKTASKFAGPAVALILVWSANGFWHGAQWTYIGYGFYYFFIIFAELLLENPFKQFCEKLHISMTGKGMRVFRFIKLFIIVIIGELFFRASTFAEGWQMLTSIFTNFSLANAAADLNACGLTSRTLLVTTLAWIPVVVYDVLKEKGYPLREKFEQLPTAARWACIYALMMAVILFGAYGPGYNAVAMMYAGF